MGVERHLKLAAKNAKRNQMYHMINNYADEQMAAQLGKTILACLRSQSMGILVDRCNAANVRSYMPVCRHFVAHKCTFGDKCRFAHICSETDNNNQKRDLGEGHCQPDAIGTRIPLFEAATSFQNFELGGGQCKPNPIATKISPLPLEASVLEQRLELGGDQCKLNPMATRISPTECGEDCYSELEHDHHTEHDDDFAEQEQDYHNNHNNHDYHDRREQEHDKHAEQEHDDHDEHEHGEQHAYHLEQEHDHHVEKEHDYHKKHDYHAGHEEANDHHHEHYCDNHAKQEHDYHDEHDNTEQKHDPHVEHEHKPQLQHPWPDILRRRVAGLPSTPEQLQILKNAAEIVTEGVDLSYISIRQLRWRIEEFVNLEIDDLVEFKEEIKRIACELVQKRTRDSASIRPST